MLLSPKDFRGWLVLAALVPLVLFVTYMAEPAVRRASFWGDDWRDLPLAERVRPLPEDAVASLRRDLGGTGPIAPARGAEYMQEDLRAVMAELPQAVEDLVADRLIGVFLVEGLSGAGGDTQNLGLALDVIGLWRQHAGTVILIDRDETDMRANRAMAGMEYVPSGDYRGIRVEARMARRDENDRRTTLRYVLLHELGHVIDYDRGITPARFRYGDDRTGCGFTCLSWIAPDRHRFSTRIDSAMRKVRGGDYDAYVRALPQTFADLAGTNFPSFYAATLPEEDFAESFAQYVHAVLMGRPWELTLRVDGTIKGRLRACFHDRRCPDKKSYFDRLLSGREE